MLKESKIVDLSGIKKFKKNYEASGVVYVNDNFYVVFDNSSKVAEIDLKLKRIEFLGEKYKKVGYEGVSFNGFDNEFYMIEEAVDNKGKLNSRLHISNISFKRKPNRNWLKYNLQYINKGMEGLASLRHDDKEYLLALCEGNDCDSGEISQEPGAGRVKIFESLKNSWRYIASIRLPSDLAFIDYSGIDIDQSGNVVVVSQESSSLWVAKLDIDKWKIEGAGVVYTFPQNDAGESAYCNLEGVSWIDDNKLVLVSDAKKIDQPVRCKEKEQSIHIVSLR